MSGTHEHRPQAATGGRRSASAVAAAAPGGRRGGPIDPVLALMHRHYDLCAAATGPLEIAAGLEVHGITDRVAARFRHRDVFALAEDLYTRLPGRQPAAPGTPDRAGGAGRADGASGPGSGVGTARLTIRQCAVQLMPGAACAVGVVVSHLCAARYAPVLGGIALAVVAAGARAAVRRGPLRAPGARGSAVWTCWLLAFALYGPQTLDALLGGGAGAPRGLLDPGAAAGFLGRASALLPAAWCARWLIRRARTRFAEPRDRAADRAGARLLLAGTLGMFTTVLLALVVPAYLLLGGDATRPGLVALGGSAALGVLLFATQLLALHGHRTAAAAGLAAACAAEALALVAAALPPTAGALRALTGAAGAGCVQAAVCTVAAAVSIGCAVPALTRAHARRAAPPVRPYDPDHAAALFGSPHAPGLTAVRDAGTTIR